ncbi:protein kinase [Coemansia guatemalensis]|uniref:Protein kinase n=1 Tax=Coemansia guatemalensis TaxID=2761395 RepID=A0A9W8I1C9_9FUNG|nr:protein kinase [Coemansia guatemalensis]
MESLRVPSQLQARNAQFQAELAAMDPVESDDPLDVYFRYVQWLFEVFPQAYGQQTLIRVVERPLRLFREQDRYRNDTRYVKIHMRKRNSYSSSGRVLRRRPSGSLCSVILEMEQQMVLKLFPMKRLCWRPAVPMIH